MVSGASFFGKNDLFHQALNLLIPVRQRHVGKGTEAERKAAGCLGPSDSLAHDYAQPGQYSGTGLNATLN